MSYLKKGLTGLAAIAIFTLLGNLVGYFTRSFLAKVIAQDQFGLFYAVNALMMMLTLVTIGFSSALIKYLAEFKAKDLSGELKYVLTFTSAVTIGASLLIALGVYLLSPWLASGYFKTPLAAPLLSIMIGVFFMYSIVKFMGSAFNGLQLNAWFGSVLFVHRALMLFGVLFCVFVLQMPLDVLTVAWGFLAGGVLTILLYIYPLAKKTAYFSIRQMPSRKLTKDIMSFSLYSSLGFVASNVITYTDTLMLTALRTLPEVGIYNVVMPTAMVLTVLSQSIRKVFFPMASEMHARGHIDQMNKGVQVMLTYSLVLLIPAVCAFIVFPKVILEVLFTAEYAEGFNAMRILAVGIVFLTVFNLMESLLRGIGKPKTVSKIVGSVTVLNVALNYVLIQAYGVLGASLATSLSFAVMAVSAGFYLRKFTGLSIRYVDFLKMFVCASVFLVAAYGVEYLIVANSLIEALISCSVAGMIYGLSALGLKLISYKELRLFMLSPFPK